MDSKFDANRISYQMKGNVAQQEQNLESCNVLNDVNINNHFWKKKKFRPG